MAFTVILDSTKPGVNSALLITASGSFEKVEAVVDRVGGNLAIRIDPLKPAPQGSNGSNRIRTCAQKKRGRLVLLADNTKHRLRAFMDKHGYSTDEMGAKVGVTGSAVHLWLTKDRVRIGTRNLQALMEIMGEEE